MFDIVPEFADSLTEFDIPGLKHSPRTLFQQEAISQKEIVSSFRKDI